MWVVSDGEFANIKVMVVNQYYLRPLSKLIYLSYMNFVETVIFLFFIFEGKKRWLLLPWIGFHFVKNINFGLQSQPKLYYMHIVSF